MNTDTQRENNDDKKGQSIKTPKSGRRAGRKDRQNDGKRDADYPGWKTVKGEKERKAARCNRKDGSRGEMT